jgi:crossover junction endodeoxyribonuclease RusA
MSPVVSFRVYGTPKPQGSKRHVGNGVMIESGGEALRTWREDVKLAALAERELLDESLSGAVAIAITFVLRRPASHFRTGKNAHLLRDAAPRWPHRKPDIDKLLRSTLDAITTATLVLDDAQIVDAHVRKRYCEAHEAEGAQIQLARMRDMT